MLLRILTATNKICLQHKIKTYPVLKRKRKGKIKNENSIGLIQKTHKLYYEK